MKNKKQCGMQTNGGQAMIIAVMFFLAGSLMILTGVSSPVLKDIKIIRNLEKSKQSVSLSEGAVEDVVYRIKNGFNFSDTESITLNGVTATATTAVISGKKEITAVGGKNNIIRAIKAVLTQESEASFNYGIQAGDGGVVLRDSAFISGNVYSNGSVTGSNSNIVSGDVISAGPSGLIDGVHATSSGYAHTITDSTLDVNAYYQSISNTTVGGTSFPGSADQPTNTMPISDSLITQWETNAQAGGVINSPCPYKIESDETIGPVKINCDLKISGSPVVTLSGTIWVAGDIEIEDSPTIRVSPSLGGNSVAMIADNPSDRIESSEVKIKNNSTFLSSGFDGSYILVISQNNDAENGGSGKAIEVQNEAIGDLLVYASHGKILIHNNVNLKEVTGYKIEARNNAKVIYETGVSNLLFTSDLSSGFNINNWLEI